MQGVKQDFRQLMAVHKEGQQGNMKKAQNDEACTAAEQGHQNGTEQQNRFDKVRESRKGASIGWYIGACAGRHSSVGRHDGRRRWRAGARLASVFAWVASQVGCEGGGLWRPIAPDAKLQLLAGRAGGLEPKHIMRLQAGAKQAHVKRSGRSSWMTP